MAGDTHGPSHGVRPFTAYRNACNPAPGASVGTITEYASPYASGRPRPISVDAANNVWYLDNGVNAIVEFAPASKTWSKYASKDGVYLGMTIGPDGNPWFSTNKAFVGLVNESAGNTLTYYSAGAKWGMDSVNGRLYFAASSSPATVGALTANGTLTTYNAPLTALHGVSGDSAGNTWYTVAGNVMEQLADSPSTFKLFKAPNVSIIDFITEGPTGTGMWFTEGNKIGNLTTAGVLKEYSLPVNGSTTLMGIVAACGNIWFVDVGGNKVGEITPSGAITEYSTPSFLGTDAAAQRIAADVNGNVWISEAASNKIAMVQTSSVVPPNGTILAVNTNLLSSQSSYDLNRFAVGNYSSTPSAVISTFPQQGVGNLANNGCLCFVYSAFDHSGNYWMAYAGGEVNGGPVVYTNYLVEYAGVPSAGASPIRVVNINTSDVSYMQGFAIDSSGQMYVSDGATRAIQVYASGASGNASPVRTISGPNTLLSSPGKMIVDASGNLYVSNSATVYATGAQGGPTLLKFAPNASGNGSPAATYFDSTWGARCGYDTSNSAVRPAALEFDPQGNLYALFSEGDVVTFGAGFTNSTCPANRFHPRSTTNDIAVDDVGYIYALGQWGVQIFSKSATDDPLSGQATPYAAIPSVDASASSGMLMPQAIAVSTASGWTSGDIRHRAVRWKHTIR